MTGHFTARQDGTVAGLRIIECTMHELNPEVDITYHAHDGDRAAPGTRLATVSGNAIDIVGAERTALNLLTYASGIATRTRQWADAIAHTHAQVRDSRKTLPGCRSLAKYAVRAGGQPDTPVETEVVNFLPWQVHEAVDKRNALSPGTKLEASGGLTLDNARVYAETGVDFIAVGELTHSVRVLDVGLDA